MPDILPHNQSHSHCNISLVKQLCTCMFIVSWLFLCSRSATYPFSDSALYSQTTPTSSSSFYEATPSSESDITGSATSQPVAVATAGVNSGAAAATAGGGYVIQGGYVLGAAGGGQSYSSPNSRAPPATVSTQAQSETWVTINVM